MPEQAPHSSISTIKDLVKRATDAGHVSQQTMADWLRRIADELAPAKDVHNADTIPEIPVSQPHQDQR